MMRTHCENEVRFAYEVPVERLRPMRMEIHVALHSHQERTVRCGRAIPRARARAQDLDVLQPALDADFASDGFSERTPAGVPRAYKQNLHAITRLRSGWARSAAGAPPESRQGESRAETDRY